jgi:hypothetical protein
MKSKNILWALVLLFNLAAMPFAGNASETPKEKKPLTEAQQARIDQMVRRVEEIKKMNRSKLSKEERKDIKKELKEMNAEAKAIRGQGVYLSLGAIIIIILLLILLL